MFASFSRQRIQTATVLLGAAVFLLVASGCAPSYRKLRMQGQSAQAEGKYGAARYLYELAEEKQPQRVENLHDLGVCSVMLARERFKQQNFAAAMRELDKALAYYERGILLHPGNQALLEGKRVTLELKGQFERALEHAEWVAEFVGPSARQHIFLAGELEDQGDMDGALLRYRQAIAMEPKNPSAHIAFAHFLFRLGNESAGIYHLQRAYKLDPMNREVANELIERNALPPLEEPVGNDG